MITFLATIFVFSLVILIHEYGHYKTAKMVGIKIEEFSMGMGPRIYKKVKNGTEYSVRLLPIGGFVRMEGEEDEVKSSSSFGAKTVWQRFKVIAAGPIMNFLLAIVIFMIVGFFIGIEGTKINEISPRSNLYQAGVRSNDKIISLNDKKVYILDEIIYELFEKQRDTLDKSYNIKVKRNGKIFSYDVLPDTKKVIGIFSNDQQSNSNVIRISDKNLPAYKAGLKDGDKIIKVGNIETNSFSEISDAIVGTTDKSLNISIERDGIVKEVSLTPVLAIQPTFNTYMEKSIVTTLSFSVYKTGYYIKIMFEFIGNLIRGQLREGSVGGPVQIVSMIGESSRVSFLALLKLTALISINLGFFNLLPIPALDGSKLVFLIIEKIRNKKIPIEKEGMVHFVGFVILIALMIFVTYKDVIKLIH